MALSVLGRVFGARSSPKLMMERGGNLALLQQVFAKTEACRSTADACKCTPSFCPINSSWTIREYSKQVKHLQQSDSESDSDAEMLGHRGETDFWRRKIRTFHGIIDVNKDGVISFDDFALLTDRFISLGHLSAEEANEFRQIIKNLWEKQWGEITPYNLVTVEQYLEDMHHVLNDRELMKRAHSFLPFLFKAVDKDQSGEISVEEFKLFFQCLGLRDGDAESSFRSIDANKDGRISLKEFVKHGRDFFLTEDETRISRHFWGPLVEH